MQELLGLTLRVTSPQGHLYFVAKRVFLLGVYVRTETVSVSLSCEKPHKLRADRKRHRLGECETTPWNQKWAVWTKDGEEHRNMFNEFTHSSPAHWVWYDPEPGAELWSVDSYIAAVTSLELLVNGQWERLL